MRYSGMIVAVCVAALPLAAVPARAQAPQMSRAEVMQLFAAAGFTAGSDGKGVTNRCGTAANPRVRFVDLNGDKQGDALIVDTSPCYGADKQWIAILAKVGGTWQQLLGVTGNAKGLQTSSNGWQDIQWTSAGIATTLHFDGTRYVDRNGLPPGDGEAATVPAPTIPSPAPAAGLHYPTDGWPAGIKATALAPAQFAAIMIAGGYKHVGREWQGCEGSSTVTPADVAFQDLNGDGRPEAIVTEGGTECFGATGSGFQILRAVPGGWQSLTGGGAITGIPDFKKTRGANGYPDVVVGGPGFCFAVDRFNGRAYDLIGFEDDGKPCKP